MKESQAIVQRVRLLDDSKQHQQRYQELELAVAESLSAMQIGQCLLVRPKTMRQSRRWDPYLRQVWYPVYVKRRVITVEIYGEDRYTPGDVLDVIGPVGRNYRFRNTLRNVLLLAYDTHPFPLRMSIPRLLGEQVGVTLVLLGEASNYPTHHLPPEVEIIRAMADSKEDPLTWQNQVTTVGWADQVFAVVPPGDELSHFLNVWNLFQRLRSDINRHYLYGVFQSVLPCGAGACDACMVRTKQGSRLACVDGPALDLSTIF